MTERFRQTIRDGRVQVITVFALIVFAAIAVIASQYDNTGVQEIQGIRRVQTDGTRCAITLPDGWSWRPASWTAVSPNGTELGFTEMIFGRPQNPEWEEIREDLIERNTGRSGVDVEATEDTVWVDFGEDGGLSYTHRFDRAGCSLTFSRAEGAREKEYDTWIEIIDSLERTAPTGQAEPNGQKGDS